MRLRFVSSGEWRPSAVSSCIILRMTRLQKWLRDRLSEFELTAKIVPVEGYDAVGVADPRQKPLVSFGEHPKFVEQVS